MPSVEPPAKAERVAPTSTVRTARSRTPRAVTPAPDRISGARDWTAPSEPCSPRCPPRSGQWCASVCTTARSGARGSLNSECSRAAAKG